MGVDGPAPHEDPAIEILSGTLEEGLEWKVTCGWQAADPSAPEGNLSTHLDVRRNGKRVLSSGFEGPPLYPDSPVNEWRGTSRDLPCFVMVRAHPNIDQVIAVTGRGNEIELALTAVVPEFELCFACAALPKGEDPGVLLFAKRGEEPRVLRTPPPPGR
ncbi:hypothetical protein [Rhodococcus sp. NCIMB 12038]|uniref:hypothetical protein n=1 Tax=Rhodococcus sp. NCIMB 12038 TaxID=933800 RepID=UPI00117B85C6|nr:hypothetical protein [Rhodococcus sp. NCIMB 12038]